MRPRGSGCASTLRSGARSTRPSRPRSASLRSARRARSSRPAMPDPLRVHITNCVLLNGGDAAIVEATVAALRSRVDRPIEFTVLDQQPEASSVLFPEYRIEPWPWDVFVPRRGSRLVPLARLPFAVGRAYAAAWLMGRGLERLAHVLLQDRERACIDAYAGADLVVSKGGTYLVERYRLAPHLFDFRLCLLLRRPLVLGSQSLGPFHSGSVRRSLARVFSCATVFVRDAASREHVTELGAPVPQVAGDAAFVLADPDRLDERSSVPDGPRVAVSVRNWPSFGGMARYEEAMAALAAHLVTRHRATVTFVSTCQGVAAYVDDDSAVARAIVARLPGNVRGSVKIDGAWHRPAELREALRDFDLVVATRMHMAILSLGQGVPVFPIAYEFKTEELFSQLGVGDAVVRIEELHAAPF